MGTRERRKLSLKGTGGAGPFPCPKAVGFSWIALLCGILRCYKHVLENGAMLAQIGHSLVTVGALHRLGN